jgi:hypothetical protein
VAADRDNAIKSGIEKPHRIFLDVCPPIGQTVHNNTTKHPLAASRTQQKGGAHMETQQVPNPVAERSLSGLIQDAKAIIQRLRTRFHSQTTAVSPPELVVPYPALDRDRHAKAASELTYLLEELRSFQQVAAPLQDEMENLAHRLFAAKERVARLEEQAERHGSPVSSSFAEKLLKAHHDLDALLNAGTEAVIASRQDSIQGLIEHLNRHIAMTRQILHILGIEQRDQNGFPATPAKKDEEPKDNGRKVKQVWRTGFMLVDQYEVEIPDDQVGDNENVKVGRDMLNDPDQRKRLSAIAGAGNSKKRSKVPALLEILAWETDADILCHVIIALGKIGDSAAVPALIGKARHNDGWVRIAVARAFGQIGDQRAVSTLTEMLTDRSKPVRLGKYGVPMETSECRISEEASDALALIKKR